LADAFIMANLSGEMRKRSFFGWIYAELVIW
jgi:hypothetical protein